MPTEESKKVWLWFREDTPLNNFNHSRQKQRPPRQFGHDNVFVNGMRAFADATHAIKGGNADAGSEVSVGASAHGRFLQRPSNRVGNTLGFLVHRRDAGRSLHRETVNRPCYF